jgi:hypothetical protein
VWFFAATDLRSMTVLMTASDICRSRVRSGKIGGTVLAICRDELFDHGRASNRPSLE